MRSVVVVLPASMWAMMPMLRVFSRGNSRVVLAISVVSCSLIVAGDSETTPQARAAKWMGRYRPRRASRLPAVVRERLVRLGHLVDVFPTFDRRAEPVRGVEDLVRQSQRHRPLAAEPRVAHEP